MKKRIFIIHGWGGSSKNDWLPWVANELRKQGDEVIVPDMPNTEIPAIEPWVSSLVKLVGEPDANTYFIGHSIGCQTILRYLETISTPVGGAIFVAGWFYLENLEDKEAEDIAQPWQEIPININKVQQILPKSILVISDNDPYGAFDKNKEKFNELGSKIVVLEKADHISKEDGYIELPQVVEMIEQL